MFPDGLTTTPVTDSLGFMASGDCVMFGGEDSLGNSSRLSAGVGGVTVVRGAGTAVWGGVLGAGRSSGSLGLSCIMSVRMGGRGGGGSVTKLCALFADKLPRLPVPPNKVTLRLLEAEEERSRAESASFLSLLNAFLNRRPGDEPRFFPPWLSGISSVDAGCVAGLWASASGLDSDAVALGPLIADSTSPCTPSVSVVSVEVV